MSAVQPYRFTVEDFERMGRAGVFAEDQRVELVDGQIVEMTPIGFPHAGAVTALLRMLFQALGNRAVVSPQNPVVLSDLSEPQPDIVIVRPRLGDYREGSHPTPEEILLVVEVADTSAPYDRSVKGPLYARAGISEYWLIDLQGRVVEVHREPSGDGYRSIEEHRGGRISPMAFSDVELDVAHILGPPPSH